MVDEVVVINYEKMICNIMKREGAVYFGRMFMKIGATDILNGPNRTISKKESDYYEMNYEDPMIVLSEATKKIIPESKLEEYGLEKLTHVGGYTAIMPVREFARFIYENNLEYME